MTTKFLKSARKVRQILYTHALPHTINEQINAYLEINIEKGQNTKTKKSKLDKYQ